MSIGSLAGGGTGTLTFTGTANQTYTDSGGNEPDRDITVNKSSGTVTLASNADWNATGQDLTITSGTLSLAGYNLLTGVLTVSNGGTLKLQGAETVTAGTKTLSSGSAVTYTGDGDSVADTYTITTLASTYENLIVFSTDAIDIFQLGSALTVNDDLTITVRAEPN